MKIRTPILSFQIVCSAIIIQGVAARDILPQYWIENIPAADGSIQQSLVFQTVAGVQYLVESSNNLTAWNVEEEIYGMGHQFVVAIRQFTPPPPPLPGNPPAVLPPRPVAAPTLIFQPASGTEGGTVVIWKSLDNAGPMTFLVEEDLHEDWSESPLFSKRYGNYYFFIWHRNQAVAPPVANPPLGTRDTAMIAQLATSFADMNEIVAESAAIIRNTPWTPLVQTPGAAKFFRIHADWGIDTDWDGSFDWMEFEVAEDSTHPSYGLANGFNSDQDANGVADGAQADFDKDLVPDSVDAAPADGLFDFPKLAIPRHALFQLPAVPEDGTLLPSPLGINNRGTVLRADGTWTNGVWEPLTMLAPGLIAISAMAQNDHGEIIGNGQWTIPSEPYDLADVTVRWSGPDAAPEAVLLPGEDGKVLFGTAIGSSTNHGPLFSNDGRMVAPTSYYKNPPGGPLERGSLDDGKPSLWTLPGNNRTATRVETAVGMAFVADGDVQWGLDAANAAVLLAAPDSPSPPPLGFLPSDPTNAIQAVPRRIVTRPCGSLLALYSGLKLPKAFDDREPDPTNSWKSTSTLGLAFGISEDGIAIGPTLPGKVAPLLYNGAWHPLAKIAPGAGAPWTGPDVILRDISSGGWILASAESKYSALLPLRVTGQFTEQVGGQTVTSNEFVGTDDFSVGSTSPGAAVLDRLWINVPLGGSRAFKFTAPLGPTHPLTVEGTGLTFNGATTSATLNAPETVVTVHAGAAAATGSEIPLTLKFGPIASASHPIGVKVMKPRTVKVSLHPVTLKRGNDLFPPDIVLTEATVKEALEKVFFRQLSISFQVKVETSTEVLWDLNSDNVLDAHDIEDANPAVSPEQGAVFGEVPASSIGANIRVFVVGTPPPPAGQENSSGLGYLSGQRRTATTYPDARRIWMSGSTRNGTRGDAQFHRTLAHEIGHVMLDWERQGDPGGGHPDDEGGVAPLAGTDPTRRLMVSAGRQGPTPGHLLVKEEWDRIELWLQQEENAGRL